MPCPCSLRKETALCAELRGCRDLDGLRSFLRQLSSSGRLCQLAASLSPAVAAADTAAPAPAATAGRRSAQRGKAAAPPAGARGGRGGQAAAAAAPLAAAAVAGAAQQFQGVYASRHGRWTVQAPLALDAGGRPLGAKACASCKHGMAACLLLPRRLRYSLLSWATGY